MANTFRKIYKKTGNSGSSSDYTLVGNVGVDGVELDIMKGATSSANGEIGLVPRPLAGKTNRCLFSDGTWKSISYTNQIGEGKSVQASTICELGSLTIENPGLYVILFRCRIYPIDSGSGTWDTSCFLQMKLDSDTGDVNYVATKNHITGFDSSFNEYDIVRIEEKTIVKLSIYHNMHGYNMTIPYATLSTIFIDE